MKELHHPHQDEALEVLKNAKTVAVVGISPDPERPSYYVSERVINRDCTGCILLIPSTQDRRSWGSGALLFGEVPEPIDIVNVFRNPAHIEPIFEEALKVGAKCVWLQPGCENMEVIEKYKDKIKIVWNACIGVEAGYL